jgi:class III poly(R)-hydroxyalkanoic acid synthase PhaE subunit
MIVRGGTDEGYRQRRQGLRPVEGRLPDDRIRVMNPLDYAKDFTDFWTTQGEAFKKAQEQAGKTFTDGMQAVASGTLPRLPSMPTDLSGGVADLTRAGQSVMEMWSAATAMCSELATAFPTAGGDATVDATFRKIIDPRSWIAGTGEMDDVLGRMAEGPRFADLGEIERRYARVLQAWMNLRRRGFEHNTVVLEAWLRAARRFTEQLAGRTNVDTQAPGTQALDRKAALALWTETANRELLETQRSEPFLQTQAALIRATTELRMAQQELVEHFGKQYGFPTRTELDDVHRTVTELRREMRILRRAQLMSTSVTPLAPATEQSRTPRPARRPSTKQRGTRT